MSKSHSVRWAFNISKWNPSQKDIISAISCVQPEEKNRLARFVFKKDLKSSLIGRLMMRKFVQSSTKLNYNYIRFCRDDKGKPFLENKINEELSFNVSHQGDYVVLAGERQGVRLGVDVMKLEYTGGKKLSEFFRIMDRNFSKSEWDEIKHCGDDLAQISMFCRFWCLKESYVKAIGVGITVNLLDISFKINSKELSKNSIVKDTELFVRGEKVKWTFQEMLIDEEHCVAVALDVEKFDSDELFREIDFGKLMDGSLPLQELDEQFAGDYFKKLEK